MTHSQGDGYLGIDYWMIRSGSIQILWATSSLNSSMHMMTLGATIRRLREEADLTQEQLAANAGISGSYLSHIEAERREPTLQVIRRIARALSVWPGLLLGAFIQTEMPDSLTPVFQGFIDEILSATDSTQLPLPLDKNRGRRATLR